MSDTSFQRSALRSIAKKRDANSRKTVQNAAPVYWRFFLAVNHRPENGEVLDRALVVRLLAETIAGSRLKAELRADCHAATALLKCKLFTEKPSAFGR